MADIESYIGVPSAIVNLTGNRDMARAIISDPWIFLKGRVFRISQIKSINLISGPEDYRFIRVWIDIENKSTMDHIDLEYSELGSLLNFINNPSSCGFIYQ